ncbi:hypothetical protein [Fluviispira multicolorata]|uniref:Uncharacterized protein n=1 Tax=Fluviispira multicolorata TaxID=2654512 RepID=A0A833JFG4_9BACT|nr:hypothetical protein [Fluviispira multicolorata]KAB8030909.1 hypothetical protein GCL57_08020 [Fluviispira multicolorata]
MSNTDSINIDSVIDVQNEHYRTELVALFKSCAMNTIVAQGEQTIEEIKVLAKNGCKQSLYITDTIDEKKLKTHETIPSIRMENLLLVDDDTKDQIIDSEGLMMFEHVLSCNQDHVPHMQLMSTIRKIRETKYFGVDKCVSYGAYVHRYVLSHSDQRQWFRDALFEFVIGLSSVLGRPTDAYAQFAVEVQEELLMNAIWDANPKLQEVDRRVPIALLPQETVQVEWSFDGTHLAIGVRDSFGSFSKPTIYKYLRFLFASEKKSMIRLQQEAAGAGLGLFMVLERLSSLIVTVAPLKSTEVIAVLNLSTSPKTFSKKQRSFQFFSV